MYVIMYHEEINKEPPSFFSSNDEQPYEHDSITLFFQRRFMAAKDTLTANKKRYAICITEQFAALYKDPQNKRAFPDWVGSLACHLAFFRFSR